MTGSSKCKGSEVGICLLPSRKDRQAIMARTVRERENNERKGEKRKGAGGRESRKVRDR